METIASRNTSEDAATVAVAATLTPGQLARCNAYYLSMRVGFGGAVTLLGCLGNTLTMVVLGPERGRSATVLALFYLAAADLLVLTVSGFMVVSVPLVRRLRGPLPARVLQMHCAAYVMPVALACNQMSVFITLLVTWQRYVSVCRPHAAKRLSSVAMTRRLLPAAAVCSLLLYLPTSFHQRVVRDYPAPGLTTTLWRDWAHHPAFSVVYLVLLLQAFTYFLPAAALACFGTALVRALRAARARRREMGVEGEGPGQRAREELTLSLILVVVVYSVCQAPAPVRRVLQWLHLPYHEAMQCGGFLFYCAPLENIALLLNSSANFVVYVLCARGFRRKLKLLFRRKNRVGSEAVSHTTSYQLDSFPTEA